LKISMVIIAGGLIATAAAAQTTSPSRPSAPAVTTTPGAPLPNAPGVNSSTGTVPGAGYTDRNTGTAAAAGDRNQAVTTTGANAPQPAKGRNSFSAGEARRRIAAKGYSNVTDLKKDGDGIWRGTGMKDGSSAGVWLDYKGNVGQQ
jgi:protein CpxP